MKKLKSILFTLMAIVTISIFMISCEQEAINEIPGDELNKIESTSLDTRYVLPKGIMNSPERIADYMNSADDNVRLKLNENYRIMEFLRNEELYEIIYTDLQEGAHLADVNLSNYLNTKQLSRLNSFSSDSHIISRCWVGGILSQYNGGWCVYLYVNWCDASTYGIDNQITFISPC